MAAAIAKPDSGLRIAPAAVWSFLKETRGKSLWTAQDMAKSLNIKLPEAKVAIPILEAQGYVKFSREQQSWITTPAGEEVSSSRMPRFTRESVEKALLELAGRIKTANKEPQSKFKVLSAVAIGDFLSDGTRVQAADVGVKLAPVKERNVGGESRASESDFFKSLKGKTGLLNVRRYEPWMSQRSHRTIF